MAARHRDPRPHGGFGHGIEGPAGGQGRIDGVQPVAVRDQPPGRVGRDEADEPAPLSLGDPPGTPAARPVAQTVDPVGVAAGEPRPHRLRVAAERGGDIRDAKTIPTQRDHPGAQDAVARPQPTAGEATNALLLPGILRIAGLDALRHGDLLQRLPIRPEVYRI